MTFMLRGGGFIRNNKNNSPKFLNFESNPMMANLVDIFIIIQQQLMR